MARKLFVNLLSTFRAAGRTAIHFRLLSVRPTILPSTFCADWRPFVNFHQLSVTGRPSVNLPLTFRTTRRPSVNFHYVQKSFCQLSVWPGYLLSTSVNFTCGRKTFRHHPLNCCVAGKFSVIFRQHSLCPKDLL